jgi:hypothetical protein
MRWMKHACLIAAFTAAAGAATAQPRYVLELFTSQGCSSCPPADKLLAQLADDSEFLVLSLPVDYWDRLGWKDTFAKHAFTERQYAYARIRGDGQVYTPQVVVNGSEHANGANRRAIDASAETTTPPRLPVAVKRAGEDIEVTVAATGSGSPRATVVLLPFFGSREVAIGRGENAKRKIAYTNVVREIIPLGEWSGAAVSFKAKLPNDAGYDGVVVLVQEGTVDNPGPILGAARLGFSKASAS